MIEKGIMMPTSFPTRAVLAGVALALGITVASRAVQAQQPAPILFEGARLITGDGSAPIENGAFIIDNGRFVQVGRAGQLTLPAGGSRVNVSGKTIMPAIINAHTHLGQTRAALIDHLQRQAYYGIGTVMSL